MASVGPVVRVFLAFFMDRAKGRELGEGACRTMSFAPIGENDMYPAQRLPVIMGPAARRTRFQLRRLAVEPFALSAAEEVALMVSYGLN